MPSRFRPDRCGLLLVARKDGELSVYEDGAKWEGSRLQRWLAPRLKRGLVPKIRS